MAGVKTFGGDTIYNMYIKVLSIGGFSRNARPFSFPMKEELTSEAERRF